MGENSWVIQVNDEVNYMADVSIEARRWQRRSIYKLPASVTNLNKTAYRPQVVSFGPYHANDQYFKPMEEHKDRALNHFLKRSKISLRYYYKSLATVAQDLKDAYDSLDPSLQQDTDSFLRIMIRDGCFMLEILKSSTQNIEGYAPNDPVFSDHGRLYVMPHIKRDMLMLENQLPMLVLYKLLAVESKLAKITEAIKNLPLEELAFTVTPDVEKITDKLVFKFFFPDTNTEEVPSNCLHVLDMYRRSLLGSTMETHEDGIMDMIPVGGDDIIRSAVELDGAGIRIVRSKTRSLRDITFDKGLLSLPMIIVDDVFESLYLNLMAFERFHVGAGNDVTAYIFFMDNIIDDARDISLLHKRDILENGIGSNKAAAKLFNSMSKDVTLDRNSRLGAVYKNVNKYCKKRWPRYRANLIHTYFTSPWALISVLAAIVLFALTTIQTAYTIKQGSHS